MKTAIIFAATIFSIFLSLSATAEISNCSHSLVSDGKCSAGGDLSKGFHHACLRHDACYLGIGDSKGQCDKLFYKDMKKKCYKKHVKCSGWSCIEKLVKSPAYDACVAKAWIFYQGVKQVGSDLPLIDASPRERYNSGQTTAINDGTLLARRNINGVCNASTESSKVFRPWFLKKESRYHHLVTKSYNRILDRDPTSDEMDFHLARSKNDKKWGLKMLKELDDSIGFYAASIEKGELISDRIQYDRIQLDAIVEPQAHTEGNIERRAIASGAVIIF